MAVAVMPNGKAGTEGAWVSAMEWSRTRSAATSNLFWVMKVTGEIGVGKNHALYYSFRIEVCPR